MPRIVNAITINADVLLLNMRSGLILEVSGVIIIELITIFR